MTAVPESDTRDEILIAGTWARGRGDLIESVNPADGKVSLPPDAEDLGRGAVEAALLASPASPVDLGWTQHRG